MLSIFSSIWSFVLFSLLFLFLLFFGDGIQMGNSLPITLIPKLLSAYFKSCVIPCVNIKSIFGALNKYLFCKLASRNVCAIVNIFFFNFFFSVLFKLRRKTLFLLSLSVLLLLLISFSLPLFSFSFSFSLSLLLYP